jgi:hypothetical protein
MEKDCSNCLWLRNINILDDHYGCSHSTYFNFEIRKNKNGKWTRTYKGHTYLIGICKGFSINNETNQLKLVNIIIND